MPPRSRLFVICGKELTEEDLTEHFKAYGDFEYCKVMTDRNSNESKGFAYVKFSRASTASIAMEDVNHHAQIAGFKVKVLIADPKSRRTPVDHNKNLDFDGRMQSQIAGPYPVHYNPTPPPAPNPTPMAYPPTIRHASSLPFVLPSTKATLVHCVPQNYHPRSAWKGFCKIPWYGIL